METSFSGLLVLLPAYLRLLDVFVDPLYSFLSFLKIFQLALAERLLEYGLLCKLRNEWGKRRNGYIYKDFKYDTLIESGKIEKIKVKELDFYLKEHGLTTIGWKLDKWKAIRCHYYRHIKESVWTQSIVWCQRRKWRESEDEEMGKNSTVRRTRTTMTLFSKIWMRRVTLHGQVISYQMTKYAKLTFKVHET